MSNAEQSRTAVRLLIQCGLFLVAAGTSLPSGGQGTAAAQTPESSSTPASSNEADADFFEAKVRPILSKHCWECHSQKADAVKGGLLLDSPAAILRGGDSGPAAIAGRSAESLLIAAVHYQDLQMPPQSRLSARDVAVLEQWVDRGLPWGTDIDDPPAELDKDGTVDPSQIAAGKRFWSLQPLAEKPLPQVSDPLWPKNRLDHFVLAGLDRAELKPSQEADRATLIRRVSYDLIGLPPTLQDVERFVADASPNSYDQLVERLLASPSYGQRWTRYWLDVVRYAEDQPNGALPPRYAYKYRDWVVKALNEDMSYAEFVRRQIAADHLPGLPLEELAALGFLGLSPTYVIDEKFSKEVVEAIKADEWEEKVDVITRGLIGLTVACARCHDHKFDPITSADYYALAGVMASTQLVETPVLPLFHEDRDNIAAWTTDLRFHEARYQARYKQRQGLIKDGEPDIYRYDKEILESASEIQRIKSLLPDDYESVPRVNAVRDAAEYVNPEAYVIRELVSPEAKFWRTIEYDHRQARDLPIHIRGSVTNLGETVPRRFIALLSPETPAPFRQGSGRLELADAIVGQAQALTARVIVNRVWGWHFGSHLVGTPSNFGALGDRPTHTDLLDDLTSRFVSEGWSLKQLHREIVLSATYRQSSRYDETCYAADPGNLHYWRMNARRLDVEAWRDAMLQVAGQLDWQIGGPSFDLQDLSQVRRTLYAQASRQGAASILKLFDYPELTRHTETRLVTTTPLQQLFFLNNPFVVQQAERLRETIQPAGSTDATISACFRSILQRDPRPVELEAARRFVTSEPESEADQELAWLMFVQSMLASNEFLFVQ